ncbi:LysM peptidoglycan-binding domain-containing protein [Nocardioides mangrovicus]|uniref:LysM peptidoglycan-binding domain-containing protein n=1 Tax=Nocardioides mangrovicus TaxID=2478913 RepID=A0A3L8P4V7_9ACTN|nr:LysM peptidoglycan-binding domain-containing protein [Nocardioides mangrovicus]RLV50062.1 LysM peptidoglycan-binding domain-containing protein [Nocardioides mangrovicus]
MSTLSLSPSFVRTPATVTAQPDRQPGRRPRRRAASARLTRLTRRGRVVVVLSFLLAALVLTTALGGWAAATHDVVGGHTHAVRVVTVQPGDTLYDIAGRVARPGQVADMVHRIQELNALPGSTVQVGQQLAIPR